MRLMSIEHRATSTTSGVWTSDVAVADVRELVREDAFELGRRSSREQAARDCDCDAARPAAGRERAWGRIVEQVEPRLRGSRPGGDTRSTVEWTIGASASGSSFAPTMPSARGRRTSTAAPLSRRARRRAKIEATR